MSLHLLDPLHCFEDHHYLEEEHEEQDHHRPPLEQPHPEELKWLLAKQEQTHLWIADGYPNVEPFLALVRKQATDWILRASNHLGFTAQTPVLAVDYLDRFLSNQKMKERQPWMAQLTAVACLSLAAKVEETHVPLLLDLQVEGSRFVFEAKTVQRMELLVLSTLGWKMNSVTPLAFIDHILRRMWSESNNSFLKRCQSIVLTIISDPRWVEFQPSILAAATILYSLDDFELSFNKNELLSLLNSTMEEVLDCSEFIVESISDSVTCSVGNKRKLPRCLSPPSPTGVVSSAFSFESSDDSWDVEECPVLKRQSFTFA